MYASGARACTTSGSSSALKRRSASKSASKKTRRDGVARPPRERTRASIVGSAEVDGLGVAGSERLAHAGHRAPAIRCGENALANSSQKRQNPRRPSE
jgi:hypothetical protein